jgi:hypothetical protein
MAQSSITKAMCMDLPATVFDATIYLHDWNFHPNFDNLFAAAKLYACSAQRNAVRKRFKVC